MTRRQLLAAGPALAAPAPPRPQPGGIALNEDNSHFFSTRAGRRLDAAAVDSWVDQYAGTQVRELFLCPNAMRTSYASQVWNPIWHGYDPQGPDHQPLFASLKPEARKGARGWVHTAWQLAQDGIDVYARWIARARQLGLSPWISMRMNDVHAVDDPRNFMHSEFWRSNPGFRRAPQHTGWVGQAFDYGHPEVREHHLRLVRELAGRYDFDGLELDWMRFGFHFRPGHEAAGAALLTDFTAQVRSLLTGWEQKRGHRIRLGARVPSRPHTAAGLGMDALAWARRRLIDMLVITPFWATIETDMPVELWNQLLAGTGVALAAGLELLVRPYPGYPKPIFNSLETVRGAAAAMLDRGASRIYLFNYMDSQTAMADVRNYRRMLSEVGSLATLAGKPRRHILTYADTWAPGEPVARNGLPAECAPNRWHAFRLATGPQPRGPVEAILGIQGDPAALGKWAVRVNGEPCAFAGPAGVAETRPDAPLYAWRVPPGLTSRGYNLIEVEASSAGTIHWVEMALA